MWRALRYLVPRWEKCLCVVTMAGTYWVPLYAGLVPYQASDPPQADNGAPAGPCPGHPERLLADRPPSAVERELWAALDGIKW
jgi:hypothetical protein